MTTHLPSRYLCLQCPTTGPCVAFEPVFPSDNRDVSLCLCGHTYISHAASNPSTLPMSLPPKGGCAASGCDAFQPADSTGTLTPQSFCICGRGWLAHAKIRPRSPVIRSSPLIPSVPVPGSSSATQPVTHWAPPASASRGSTVNEQRVNSFTSHRERPTGISSSASPFAAHSGLAPRPSNTPTLRKGSRPIRVRSQASAGSSSGRTASILRVDNFTCRIVFIPYQIYSTSVLELEDEEEYPRKLNVDRNKLLDLLLALRRHHLVFDFSCPIEPNDPEARERLLLEPLNQRILSHFDAHDIAFTTPSSHLPTNSATEIRYEKADWVILELGKLKERVVAPLRIVTSLTTWSMTFSRLSELLQRTSGIMPNPEDPTPQLLFVAPRFGKLKGPLPGFDGIHTCFASRVMEGFLETRPPPACFTTCHQTVDSINADSTESYLASILVEDDEDDILLNTPLSFSTAGATQPAESMIFNDSSSFFGRDRIQVGGASQSINSRAVRPSPLRQPGFFGTRHPSHSSIADWASYLEDLVEESPSIVRWRAEASTANDLAQLLSSFVLSRLSGEPLDTASLPNGAHIADETEVSLLSLFKKNRFYQVGEGLGEGVERAVLTNAISQAVSDRSMWTDTTDRFKSISILSLPLNQSKLESKIRMQGFLCALHIYILRQPPFPCSPFLLLYAIGTPDLLLDLDLVKSLAPEIGNMFAAVDAGDDGLVLHNNSSAGTLTALLGTYLGIEPSCIPQDFTQIQCMDLKRQLYASALLGPRARFVLSKYAATPLRELELFKEGFDSCVTDIVSFSSTLKSSAKALVTEMYNRKMKSPTELISCIKYPYLDNPTAHDATVDLPIADPALVTSFVLQFSRYLRGMGHPDHPRIRAVVSEEEMLAEKENLILRSELFLRQVSGGWYLPVDPLQDIHVEFTTTLPAKHQHLRPDDASSDWQPYVLPLQFQTCTYRMTVPFSRSLITWLQDPCPDHDDSIATEFDCWVHASLLDFPAGDLFNTL